MADNTIRFDQIPRTSRLFNDFLYDFDRVSRFYEPGGLDVSALVARAPKVAAETFPRAVVADALADQNARAGAGERTFANIERLRQKDSVVVITGQQAGLFTGPLYTIYKALTVL
ncbi:MAG: bacillithiol biosynthesis BshC, partial [Chloracidobacterium sp.]|nr:bacillithiol biosynthesis BshC [Chloracidobacterium sp.]